MKLALAFLALCYAIFFTCLIATSAELPARCATHFNAAGEPNGWMTRGGYLHFICGMAAVIPLFMIVVSFVAGRFGRLNIPHREYWLAPNRRATTVAIALRYVVVLAAMVVLLHAALHLLVVVANQDPAHPHMSFTGTWMTVAGFLVAVVAWIVALRRRFALPHSL
jgi:uncharacterized membrane protein